MPDAQDTELLAITARYTAEAQAGQRPRLSDYLARYPRYAAEIADFVAYYHACEEPLLYDAGSTRATRASAPPSMASLLAAGAARQFTPARLAARLDLSLDLLTLLERRGVAAPTIPQTLYLKLASLLHVPVSVVQAYFFSSETRAVGESSYQKVAESASRYAPISDARPTFQAALVSSAELSPEQKARWQAILVTEQGEED